MDEIDTDKNVIWEKCLKFILIYPLQEIVQLLWKREKNHAYKIWVS